MIWCSNRLFATTLNCGYICSDLQFIGSPAPVNDLPCIGQISNDLHGDQDLLFDVDGADHLVQELPGVGQKLAHLQVRVQLVKLLHLKTKEDNIGETGIRVYKHNNTGVIDLQ